MEKMILASVLLVVPGMTLIHLAARLMAVAVNPDGHFKIPHFWPPKIPQAGLAKL